MFAVKKTPFFIWLRLYGKHQVTKNSEPTFNFRCHLNILALYLNITVHSQRSKKIFDLLTQFRVLSVSYTHLENCLSCGVAYIYKMCFRNIHSDSMVVHTEWSLCLIMTVLNGFRGKCIISVRYTTAMGSSQGYDFPLYSTSSSADSASSFRDFLLPLLKVHRLQDVHYFNLVPFISSKLDDELLLYTKKSSSLDSLSYNLLCLLRFWKLLQAQNNTMWA